MFGHWLKGPGRPEPRSEWSDRHEAAMILRGLVKEYPTAGAPFPALKGIDLTITNGALVGIVGKSGSGKTTLLNMIDGIDRPTRGEVYVGGTPVHRLGEAELAVWRGRNVGVIFQSFELLPSLSVLDNVMLPMDFAGQLSARAQRERGMDLLEEVGVAAHAAKRPAALSGGQQQRVAIARALANDPPIVVADEPTGNLDSRTADAIFDLFARLAHGGKTVVLVSHDPDLTYRVDRTITLVDGRLGGVDSVRATPATSGAAT